MSAAKREPCGCRHGKPVATQRDMDAWHARRECCWRGDCTCAKCSRVCWDGACAAEARARTTKEPR